MAQRAAVYCRVSTSQQLTNYSIPTQLSRCIDYATEKGYTVVGDQFVDPATGRPSANGNGAVPAYVDGHTSRELSRPGLDGAFSFLETTGFDVLIVYTLDRLARDQYIRQTLEIEFREAGAKVQFVLGNYAESAEGEIRKDLDATFAKWENAKRVERCNRGKLRKAQAHKFVCGRAPYGYRIDRNAPGGLVVDDREAAVVQRIFGLFAEGGQSIRRLVRVLNREGVAPHTEGSKWAKSSVARILRNRTYVGRCFYNKHKRVGRRILDRDPSEWVEIRTTPIVDQRVFAEVQRRLEENGKLWRRTPRRFYLLNGKVLCANCGRPYSGQTRKGGSDRRLNESQSYRHRKAHGHCLNRQISARRLEPAVWDAIVQILLDPKQLREGYEQSLEQQTAKLAHQRVHLDRLLTMRGKAVEKRHNLTAAYIDPDIGLSKSEYLVQKATVDDTIKAIDGDVERLKKELAEIPTPVELETLERFASEIGERLDGDFEPPDKLKREILDILHVKVLVDPEGSISADGWFRAESDGLLSITL